MTSIHAKINLEKEKEKEKEYPKLVRDKIPDVIKKNTGKKVLSRTIDEDEEYLAYLMKKVEEESQELSQADDKEHVIEEIADVLELIDALTAFYDVDMSVVKKVQKEKARQRGGFENRLLMLKKVDD